jgi:hypothetical protein
MLQHYNVSENMASSPILIVSKHEQTHMCIMNVYTRVHMEPTHEQPPRHYTVQLKAICACAPHGGATCAKFNTDICAVVQPNLPALVQKPQHLHGVTQGDIRL